MIADRLFRRLSCYGIPAVTSTAWELADFQADPRGMRNLAGDSASAGLKATFRAKLEQIGRTRGMANAPEVKH